jgi:hypothetical protein
VIGSAQCRAGRRQARQSTSLAETGGGATVDLGRPAPIGENSRLIEKDCVVVEQRGVGVHLAPNEKSAVELTLQIVVAVENEIVLERSLGRSANDAADYDFTIHG